VTNFIEFRKHPGMVNTQKKNWEEKYWALFRCRTTLTKLWHVCP